jgi:hypothetical protein
VKYDLTAYSTSSTRTRYFCSTCGAHIFVHHLKDNSWHIASGLLNRTEGILRWTGCEWLGDTLDGGISIWLKEIKDSDGKKRPLNRWLLDDCQEKNVPSDDELVVLPVTDNNQPSEILKAQCHCGGVKFHITRPNDASAQVKSPFPDLIVPYHSHSSANPNNETWWLRRDGKYLAGTCTCTSCRLASGFEIQPWAFVPKGNLIPEDGKGLDFRMGTLKSYLSSKGIWREFCGVCGANVFWHCEERPDLIDVSVGLLDPAQGARAEQWLEWWEGRVSFRELCVSESLVASLEAGLRH